MTNIRRIFLRFNKVLDKKNEHSDSLELSIKYNT